MDEFNIDRIEVDALRFGGTVNSVLSQLIAIIKERNAKIEALKKENADLKSQLSEKAGA